MYCRKPLKILNRPILKLMSNPFVLTFDIHIKRKKKLKLAKLGPFHFILAIPAVL